jgi:uncharacterized RDD family membrane protein YckC
MGFCAKCGAELPAGATFCPVCGTPVGQASGAAPMSSSAPTSGFDTLTKDSTAQSYWIERLVAYFIDAVIVFVILGILLALVAVSFFFAGGFGAFGLFFGTFALLGGIIFVLYFTVTESSSGASIGKRLFHLKVQSKTGANPTFSEAFIRNISKIYWLLLLLDVIIGLATSKGYQQKWTDEYVGTKVVKV